RGGVLRDVCALPFALAVQPRIVEGAIHLRGHPFQRGLEEAGGQLLAADLEDEIHQPLPIGERCASMTAFTKRAPSDLLLRSSSPAAREASPPPAGRPPCGP